MLKKESKYLVFNNLEWQCHQLGESCHLLKAKSLPKIEQIHHTSKCVAKALSENLVDITPAYDSIAVFTPLGLDELILILESHSIDLLDQKNIKSRSHPIIVPICYEFGKDLERVAKHNELSMEEVIETHLQGTYQSAVIGFQPGFIYAEGLSRKIHCPRKSVPERKVLAGSVGIGGTHSGIYSFDSPGGWNIIGRTPIILFDKTKKPPTKLPLGSFFKFVRISSKQFEQWVN